MENKPPFGEAFEINTKVYARQRDRVGTLLRKDGERSFVLWEDGTVEVVGTEKLSPSPEVWYAIPSELFHATQIPPQAKIVYAYLLHQKREGVASKPNEVADALSISPPTLWRHRKLLEKHGYLEPTGTTIRIRR